MDWVQLADKWKTFAGSARAHWAKLTDDDVELIAGRRAELIAVVQQRYGLEPVEAGRQVDEWAMGLLDVAEPVRRRAEQSASPRFK